MLQYYTLEEAANLLGITPDKAKKLLDDKKVRQYRDGRGKVRYVASAVDELARSLGRGSDPEVQLGEAPRPKAGSSPRPGKGAKAGPEEGGDFDFSLPLDESEDVPIGGEKLDESASKKSGRGGTKAAGSKSPAPRSPAPKPGTDSDVRLVTEGGDDFQINVDSDVKMVDESAGPPSSSKSGGAASSGRRKASSVPEDAHGDSEVRIVPMELPSDSDVRVADDQESAVNLDKPPGKKHSDSDIRLEQAARAAPHPGGSDDALVTEEIDLDAEERKAQEAAKPKGRSKVKRKDAKPPLPTTSPFELSENDLDLPAGGKKKPDSSSDFELTPAAESSDSVELSSGEIPAVAEDSSEEEVALGELSGAGAGNSGINLDAPMDSGISLEGSESSSEEFELSAEAPATPKPAPKSSAKAAEAEEDSDSEFELTLDADSSAEEPVLQPAAAEGDESDSSEFELTLDDSGGLVPLEGDQPAAAAQEEAPAEEGDIFETDFEVPALDEESGSEAVALDESDTDLESSDFDLALEEGDAAGDEESGSQVVALEDEEEVDESAETVQRPGKKKAKKKAAAKKLADEDVDEMLETPEEGEEPLEELAGEEAAEEEEEPRRGRAPAVAAAPAQWGPVPALVLLPCVIVMLLAGLMGYELINNMLGYQQPGKVSGFLADALAKTFDMDLPKD